ncbi:glucose-6-phosphate isomerase-like [Ylistrum balloti]|uniref:glucose-6-phosphate isomerase-like n=1 Tax=Ylistrum balloti TaxID=509963 RepID=UPI002905A347|nr:glucose-6-phosphate isomerase-like [Ylistrum balloti]
MAVEYKNLTECSRFKALQKCNMFSFEHFSEERIRKYNVKGAEYQYNYAAKQVDDSILSLLFELAQEQQVKEKFTKLANGETMNTGEKRMVLHHALRGQLDTAVVQDGRDYHAFYREERERCADFAEKVHSEQITGSTGKPFRTFIQIGIGGSDLGPRAIYLALKPYVDSIEGNATRRKVGFISNVDPDDAAVQLADADPEHTLFILVSKSGTTQETLTNAALALDWLSRGGIRDPKKHMVCVTSESSPLAQSSEYLDSFFIDDYIGGRYSVSSAVGLCILFLAFGKEVPSQFLDGMHAADALIYKAGVESNPALIDALIGVYERNILGYPYTAVLPYSQALHRFPAHLQQLDMESNGKQSNRSGAALNYSTGPVIFGEPGTNGQHSFYQLLHQGTDIVPLQFIAFAQSQIGRDIEYASSTSQKKLLANLAAQIIAFTMGKASENPHKVFKGGRPASVLYAKKLLPSVLGALLSHFENKVMFQGFLWNINSFDQEGVQLGKVLTDTVLNNQASPLLRSMADLLFEG